MMKKLWEAHREYIILILAFAAFITLMMIFNIPCPIKHLTGLSCAGCGMTRALLSAVKLDFTAAFYYHPLWVILLPSWIFLTVLSVKKNKTAFNITLSFVVVIFLSVWIYRLATGDGIAAFDFENSAINRVIQKTRDCCS